MPRKLVYFLMTATLLFAACGDDGPDYGGMVGAWWASAEMTTQTQATVCVLAAELGGGFELIAAASEDDGQIDLLDGGMLEDTLPNRRGVGEAIDDLLAGECG